MRFLISSLLRLPVFIILPLFAACSYLDACSNLAVLEQKLAKRQNAKAMIDAQVHCFRWRNESRNRPLESRLIPKTRAHLVQVKNALAVQKIKDKLLAMSDKIKDLVQVRSMRHRLELF